MQTALTVSAEEKQPRRAKLASCCPLETWLKSTSQTSDSGKMGQMYCFSLFWTPVGTDIRSNKSLRSLAKALSKGCHLPSPRYSRQKLFYSSQISNKSVKSIRPTAPAKTKAAHGTTVCLPSLGCNVASNHTCFLCGSQGTH